ncbi:hypothetical protein KC19_6G059300, partial [Ceratodon purpureus]
SASACLHSSRGKQAGRQGGVGLSERGRERREKASGWGRNPSSSASKQAPLGSGAIPTQSFRALLYHTPPRCLPRSPSLPHLRGGCAASIIFSLRDGGYHPKRSRARPGQPRLCLCMCM